MNQQMELGFGTVRDCPSRRRRQERRRRANWWFDRMREVVNNALEWHSAPPARPEQIWFPE